MIPLWAASGIHHPDSISNGCISSSAWVAWHGVRLFLFLSEGVKEELNVEPDLDTQPFFVG